MSDTVRCACGSVRSMLGRHGGNHLQRELRIVNELEKWSRDQLYGVPPGGRRAEATTAVAASAAEETYRLIDQLPEWQNETSAEWRIILDHLWEFLAGDRAQHHVLSRALAEYLLSPLNHDLGQDGPDDFDRPQTLAAYSAALSAVAWGVDFATTAITQIFDAVDLKYGGVYDSDTRWAEVQHEVALVRRKVTAVVSADPSPGAGFEPDLLAWLRG